MEPSLRQIRYFVETAKAGQVSKAAVNIHISQSAITTAIRTLEEMIGTPLFKRQVSGMALTYEGNLFFEHAQHILESVEEAIRIPSRLHGDVQGRLKLAVTYTISGYFLPPLLSRFTRTFPNIQVVPFEADRNSIEDGLITGQYDLAVMLISNIVKTEELASSSLWKSRRRLWVDAHHRFLERTSIPMAEIADEPYIMLTVDEASITAQRYWDKTACQPNTIFRTSSVESVRSMVANGMGVSILSDMVHRPWSLEGRRIEAIEVSEPVPTMDIGMAWLRGAELNAVARTFKDFLHLSMGTGQLPGHEPVRTGQEPVKASPHHPPHNQ